MCLRWLLSCMHVVIFNACQGIDLEVPYRKRLVTEDLDHVVLDAMLEGFDTGVSCCVNHGVHVHICLSPCKWPYIFQKTYS